MEVNHIDELKGILRESREGAVGMTGQMWRCFAMKANLMLPPARKKPPLS